MAGKLITLEGIEGAGKSSALNFIKTHLQQFDLIITREPGGTPLAEEIRKILLFSHTETMQAQTELLLMFACRAQHIDQCIKPALNQGKWVLSDRYIDASYAYQGYGRGMDIKMITCLDEMIVGNLYPQLTILMDVSPEIGLLRAEKRQSQKDRIEQEKIDFFQRVRAGYLQRAKHDPKRIKIIDANQELKDVQTKIVEVLQQFLMEMTA